jgi:hypothetical protein
MKFKVKLRKQKVIQEAKNKNKNKKTLCYPHSLKEEICHYY